MSNFQFLQTEFKPLYEPAASAEQLAHSDPRAACMRARHALELTVHWLYDIDRTLRRPYDRSLNALITQPDFEELMSPQVYQKCRLIQKFGNSAVHSRKPVPTGDAIRLIRELFHVLYWVARTYTRASNPKEIRAEFDDKRLNPLVTTQQAAAFTREELRKQEEKFQQELDAKHADLESREAAIAEQARTVEEREAELAKVNAELVDLRAALAEAKANNIKVPDEHDYREFETRKLLIDVLLREAGWTVGDDAAIEYPVVGMPNESGEGFVDYVLLGRDGKPLAVVEAKRSLKDPDVGKQQAKLYADCLEKMKGQRPLIFYTNGYKTWFWDDTRAAPRAVQGFYTRDELELAIQRRTLMTDLRSLHPRKEIAGDGRPYQVRAIASIAESFMQGQRRALLAMATGTGKTRTAIALVDLLMRANWAKRVLFLADRIALVNQAANAFKAHLPDSSPVNLITEKNSQGRVFLSTYPTMMGLIDKMNEGQRRFGVGHFDLIIIDEAHRSVYQKYGAIFDYFDSYLVGLTATPRDEVDRDTYHLFGLETGVPTDAYGLEEAVQDGFLVPPRAFDVPLKFVREGIVYDQLSEEEKEHWESLEWGDRTDGATPDAVQSSAINKWLFNEDTVDKMLKHLMEHGLRVEAGEKLGKTIIFAANQQHAQFIGERFDHHYPQYKGQYASVITYAVNYAQSLIDDFSNAQKPPQIAISVDMLDTGIDVPEVLNLVFFKAVRSKVKFLQMIGRGTRLCENLLGPDEDKAEFYCFDFCGNFEYFNENPGGATGSTAEPLGKRLFRRRLELISVLPEPETGENEVSESTQDLTQLREDVTNILHTEVSSMNLDNFLVRPQREHVERFVTRSNWDALDTESEQVLLEHVAGLPSELEEEHITAKLFDLSCLNLQLALAEQTAAFEPIRSRVVEIAAALEELDAIPAVAAHMALIQAVQGEEYWQDVTLPMLEQMRRKLRGLIQFIEKTASKNVYSALDDEIGAASETGLGEFTTGINLAQYRKKVEKFIRDNRDHLAFEKLRRNKPLTAQDLEQLEKFVYESGEVDGREQFHECYGEDHSLPTFIRTLVGMDRAAAKKAFSRFLDEAHFNSTQIRFVEMIIETLTEHGTIDPGALYEAPFTGLHYEGVEGVFRDAEVEDLFQVVQQINRNAAGSAA